MPKMQYYIIHNKGFYWNGDSFIPDITKAKKYDENSSLELSKVKAFSKCKSANWIFRREW